MAADSGFDHEFVRQQIEHHKQELIAIKMFGGAAKDDDLKDDLKRATPLLERHLARACGRGAAGNAGRYDREPCSGDRYAEEAVIRTRDTVTGVDR